MPIGHMHGGFSDAVHIGQLSTSCVVLLVPRFQCGDLESLPTKDRVPYLVRFLAARLRRDQLPESARRLVENSYLASAYQAVKIFRRTRTVLRNHNQTTAME